MIVTVHLLCGRGVSYGDAVWGRFLYNDNTTALKAGFGGMLPQENFEKIVSFGAFFVYIWIRFCLK